MTTCFGPVLRYYHFGKLDTVAIRLGWQLTNTWRLISTIRLEGYPVYIRQTIHTVYIKGMSKVSIEWLQGST